MSQNNQEIESKFYIRDLPRIEAALKQLGAECVVPRTYEFNVRFEDPTGSLRQSGKVLRLRHYDDNRITFKGPGEIVDGALSRVELEIVIDNFDTALKIIQALGYHPSAVYEKFRGLYRLEGALIALDELPYGNFVEIEGPSPEAIKEIAVKLGIKAQYAIPASYMGLFEHIKKTKNLPARFLTFKEFQDIQVSARDMGLLPADL